MQLHKMDQGSQEWHHIRKGKITGTTLKAIMGTKAARQEALYEIVAERLTNGRELQEGENAMDRGNRLEPEAVAIFEFETGKKTEKIGFAQSDRNDFIGNSPDRMISNTKEEEMLEIKCPLGKNYVKMWEKDEVPDEYSHQVTQYFVVNDNLKTLYFMGYNPNIPVHPFHIMTIKRESILYEIESARDAQETFLQEVEANLATKIPL